MRRIHAVCALVGLLVSGAPLVAAQLAPVAAPQDAPRISGEEARALVQKGDAVIVDVRTKEGFAIGHVEGAVNIPLADVGTRMKELPKGKAIIAYCT